MSRLMRIILLTVIVISLLFSQTACAITMQLNKDPRENVSSEQETLILWHQWVNVSNKKTNPLKDAIREWNIQNPGTQVKEVSWNGEQYKSKIRTALAANEAPDLFYMWGGSFVEPYISGGNILPLDSYINVGTLDKLVPGAVDYCRFEGKIYSLPMYIFIASLYCNTQLFEQAGAKIPKTYDELLEAVNKLRAKGIIPVVVGEKDRWTGMYWYNILAMRQAGNQVCLNALDNPAQFENQAFEAAADKLLQLVNAKAFNNDALSTSFNDMVAEFSQGKAAMMYQGNWVESTIEESGSATKKYVTVVPFPVINGGSGTLAEFYGGSADGFYVNINTRYRQEAVNVLEFISEKAGKEGYLSGAGFSCWKTDDLDKSQMSPISKQSLKLMETGTSFVNWWDTILPAADAETHKDLVAELFAGRMSSKEFVRKMAGLNKSVY